MKTIVIIDDSLTAMHELLEILKMLQDIVIVSFYGTKNALVWAERNDFDLVIVDHYLPEMTGFEFLKRLREIKKIPAIMITASDVNSNLMHIGQDLGVVKILYKPIDTTELVDLLDCCFNGRA